MKDNFFKLVIASVSVVCSSMAADHPLDPLTPRELREAVAIVKASSQFPTAVTYFDRVELKEPPKKEVYAFRSGDNFRREAIVSFYTPSTDSYIETVVDLNNNKLASFRKIKGARPPWITEETVLVEELVRADPEWQAAIRKRGITNFNRVSLDISLDGRLDNIPGCGSRCTEGLPNLEGSPRPRVYYASSFFNDGLDTGSYYIQPIEGLIVYVDTNAKKVLKVIDLGVDPVIRGTIDFNRRPRGTLKPLCKTQPEGPSYTINGNEIQWEKWKFRFSMHPRTGLVLHLVTYNDNGTERVILYRANVSEIIATYGDPELGWTNRNFLDYSEYPTRAFISPLKVGVDVPPIAQLFTNRFVDEFGNVYGIRNSLAIYEQDAGVLWRHFDFGLGIFGRRSRQLVLTHTNTIGNYDYAIYWIFNQDGKIDVRVGLTGQLENRGTRFTQESERIKFGELVARRLIGTNHQHSMNFRLDFDLDGRKNRVIEHNTKQIRSCKENPCANAWTDEEKVLTTEKKAQRDLNIETSRHWVVVNESSRTRLGHHRGYALEPLTNTFALQGLATRIAKRTLFTRHHLFVTRFKNNELDAMGEYPVEQPVDVGLKKYIANNENIVDKDIVLWYTINFSHTTRVEEHPLMPVDWVGFSLVPHNFFEENPGLDVDPNKLC